MISTMNQPVSFVQSLKRHNLSLGRAELTTLQINTGLLCNLACGHCHLEAGPARKEIMSAETVEQVLGFAGKFSFSTIDITGGAPEMNPYIFELLAGAASLTPKLLLRTNLVAISGEGRRELLELCRDKGVVIIASFPALNEAQAEAQRGKGAFLKSIEILRCLNHEGYGKKGSGLELNLVSNPSGAFMPSGQNALEERFHQVLKAKWNIEFNHLFSLVNVPLGRFEKWLLKTNNYAGYMAKLVDNFNPEALAGVMCRSLISVAWDGYLYDCDFNQAAGLPLGGVKTHIAEISRLPEPGDSIVIADHCYACTAGAGFT